MHSALPLRSKIQLNAIHRKPHIYAIRMNSSFYKIEMVFPEEAISLLHQTTAYIHLRFSTSIM